MFNDKIRQFFRGSLSAREILQTLIYQIYLRTKQKQRLTPQEQLSYFILNIVDHCNLRCKGCDHFASIAEERFVSLEHIKRDLARMSILLNGNVKRIGVMGGEPLLHPELKQILISARVYFPDTLIQLVTNGLLLLRQDEEFWQICRENNITLVNTRYPINLDYEKIKKTAEVHHVLFEHYGFTGKISKYSHKVALDIEGKQDPYKSFTHCSHANRFPLLMEGKLYSCPITANIRHFNKKFGTHMELADKDILDIYQVNKASKLLNFLCSPKPFCRYCNVVHRSYGLPWNVPDKK